MSLLRCFVTFTVASATMALSPGYAKSLSFRRFPTTMFGAAPADDIIARAQEKAGMPDVPEAPKIFEDDLLQDMQLVLLAMEKRVKEGPGSLTADEADLLGQRLDGIVEEMKRNEHIKPVRPTSQSNDEAALAAPSTGGIAATSQAEQSSSKTSQKSKIGVSQDEEGPAYDGKGGMGQPRGTVNTYIIEGMDEMDSEEYRLALQQSLIDRQRARRQAGHVGNRGSLDYLSSLGGSPEEKRIMRNPEPEDD